MDVRKTFRASFLRYVFSLVISAAITGCGGGGDSGGATDTSTDTQPEIKSVVGGTVSTPSATHSRSGVSKQPGQVRRQTKAANSDLFGAVIVPDGTPVELARIDTSGNIVDVIASTQTANGRYSFDFEELGLQFASDLIVRAVIEASTEQLRASVTYGTADIDPISEAMFRLIFKRKDLSIYDLGSIFYWDDEPSINFESMSTFTLTRVAAALRLFAKINNFSVLSDVESSVNGFLHRLSTNEEVAQFVESAYRSDITDWGPGDIGNYYPLQHGASWKYEVAAFNVEGIKSTHTKTVKISDEDAGLGTCDTIFVTRDPMELKPRMRYLGKSDVIVSECETYIDGGYFAYDIAYLPPVVGLTRVRADYDGDGTRDHCSGYPAHVTVLGFETVTVPFGTFENVIKVKTEARTLTDLQDYCAGNPGGAPDFRVITEWLAPSLGLIKKVSERPMNAAEADAHILMEELTAVTGLERPIAEGVNIVPVRARHMVYDEATDRIYASIAGTDTGIANTITVINPNTAQVESFVPIDSEPGPLAVSNDGQLLYVGLRDASKMVVIDVPSLQVRSEIDLGANPSDKWYHADDIYAISDIEVSPTDPNLVAVAMRSFDGLNFYDQDQPIAVDIYRNATKVATTFDAYPLYLQPAIIEFAEGNGMLYGYSTHSSPTFYEWSIDGNEIRELGRKVGVFPVYNEDFVIDHGLIFAEKGQLNDLMSKQQLGQFDLDPNRRDMEHCSGIAHVAPHAVGSRVYYLCDDDVMAFDVNSFELTGTFDLPVQSDTSSYLRPNLIRAGDERVAVAYGPNLVLIKTSVIR